MLFLFLVNTACQSNDPLVVKSKDTPSKQTVPAGDSGQSSQPEICATAPLITWDNWARGLITTHCQGCHASASPNRYGAPINCSFDNEQQTLSWLERIRIRVLEQEDMPPAGGLLDEDLEMLEIWIECWAETDD